MFQWNEDREHAAELVAAGNLTFEAIAVTIGITSQTLLNWRKTPEFTARVREYIAVLRDEARSMGLALRERRVRALNDRWHRLKRIMDERAEDPKFANIPGGRTGLIVHDVKGVGGGESAQVIDLYRVDTGLLAEFRAIEKQAAQELGQWSEKHEIDYTTKSDEELLERARRDPVIQRAMGIVGRIGPEGTGSSEAV